MRLAWPTVLDISNQHSKKMITFFRVPISRSYFIFVLLILKYRYIHLPRQSYLSEFKTVAIKTSDVVNEKRKMLFDRLPKVLYFRY